MRLNKKIVIILLLSISIIVGRFAVVYASLPTNLLIGEVGIENEWGFGVKVGTNDTQRILSFEVADDEEIDDDTPTYTLDDDPIPLNDPLFGNNPDFTNYYKIYTKDFSNVYFIFDKTFGSNDSLVLEDYLNKDDDERQHFILEMLDENGSVVSSSYFDYTPTDLYTAYPLPTIGNGAVLSMDEITGTENMAAINLYNSISSTYRNKSILFFQITILHDIPAFLDGASSYTHKFMIVKDSYDPIFDVSAGGETLLNGYGYNGDVTVNVYDQVYIDENYDALYDVNSLTCKKNGVSGACTGVPTNPSSTYTFPITEEGFYELIATDNVGRNTSYEFYIDYTTPSNYLLKNSSGILIDNGTYINGDVKVSYTDNFIDSKIAYSINGGQTFKIDFTTTIVSHTFTQEGTYSVEVFDVAGNQPLNIDGDSYIYTFTIDKSAPTITPSTVISPFNGDVTLTIEDDNLNTIIKTIGVENINIPLDPSNEYVFNETGDYTITATDLAGNIKTYSFSIDKDLPYFIMDSGTYFNSSVYVQYNDLGTGLEEVYYYKNDGAIKYSITNMSNYTFTLDGKYEIFLKDYAGNVVSKVFYIDTEAPSISSEESIPSITNQDILLSITDFTTRIDRIELYDQFDNYIGLLDLDESNEYLFTDTGYYKIIAFDLAGLSSIVEFEIDKVIPIISDVLIDGDFVYTGQSIIPYDPYGVIDYMTINGYNILDFTEYIIVPGTYDIVVRDQAGNEATLSFTVLITDHFMPKISWLEWLGMEFEDEEDIITYVKSDETFNYIIFNSTIANLETAGYIVMDKDDYEENGTFYLISNNDIDYAFINIDSLDAFILSDIAFSRTIVKATSNDEINYYYEDFYIYQNLSGFDLSTYSDSTVEVIDLNTNEIVTDLILYEGLYEITFTTDFGFVNTITLLVNTNFNPVFNINVNANISSLSTLMYVNELPLELQVYLDYTASIITLNGQVMTLEQLNEYPFIISGIYNLEINYYNIELHEYDQFFSQIILDTIMPFIQDKDLIPSITNEDVIISITDSLSGIDTIELYDKSNQFVEAIDIELDGIYTFSDTGFYKLVVTDLAGNTNELSFEIDKENPVISETLVNGTNYYGAIELLPYDVYGEIEYMSINGYQLDTFNTILSAPGEYTIYVRDYAGNESMITFNIILSNIVMPRISWYEWRDEDFVTLNDIIDFVKTDYYFNYSVVNSTIAQLEAEYYYIVDKDTYTSEGTFYLLEYRTNKFAFINQTSLDDFIINELSIDRVVVYPNQTDELTYFYENYFIYLNENGFDVTLFEGVSLEIRDSYTNELIEDTLLVEGKYDIIFTTDFGLISETTILVMTDFNPIFEVINGEDIISFNENLLINKLPLELSFDLGETLYHITLNGEAITLYELNQYVFDSSATHTIKIVYFDILNNRYEEFEHQLTIDVSTPNISESLNEFYRTYGVEVSVPVGSLYTIVSMKISDLNDITNVYNVECDNQETCEYLLDIQGTFEVEVKLSDGRTITQEVAIYLQNLELNLPNLTSNNIITEDISLDDFEFNYHDDSINVIIILDGSIVTNFDEDGIYQVYLQDAYQNSILSNTIEFTIDRALDFTVYFEFDENVVEGRDYTEAMDLSNGYIQFNEDIESIYINNEQVELINNKLYLNDYKPTLKNKINELEVKVVDSNGVDEILTFTVHGDLNVGVLGVIIVGSIIVLGGAGFVISKFV